MALPPLVGLADDPNAPDLTASLLRLHLGAKLDLDGDASPIMAMAAGGAVARSMASRFGVVVEVADYLTPAMVAANDCTAAINAALATGHPVRLLPGPMRVTGALNCSTNGQRIMGHGRTVSVIMVDAAFNVSAAGMVVALCGEPGPEFCDFSVQGAQPDTADYTALVKYPPAFLIKDTPRCRFTNIRILACYDGIDFAGNSGGVYVDGLETSCLSKNVHIDGSIDSMRFLNWHCFPTGLSTAQQIIFNSANCYGLHSGRCDDLHLTDCLWLCGRDTAVYFFNSGTGPLQGTTFGTIIGCDFDTNAGLQMLDGNVSVIGGEMTMGDGFSHALTLSGGYLRVIGSMIYAAYVTPTLSMMQVSGGVLILSGNTITTHPDIEVLHVTNGQINVTGNQFVPELQTGPLINPSISLLGGTGSIIGNTWHTFLDNSRRVAVSLTGDLDYAITANNFNGYDFAATVQPQMGAFDGNLNCAHDLSGRVLVGKTRTLVLETFTTDAAGNLAAPHGLDLASQKIIRAQAFCRTTDGTTAAPLTITGINSLTVNFSGGPANAACRATVDFINQSQGW